MFSLGLGLVFRLYKDLLQDKQISKNSDRKGVMDGDRRVSHLRDELHNTVTYIMERCLE